MQVLSEQIISNESRIAKTKVILNFNKPRQMTFTFLVRYEDFGKVEAICSDMKDHLLNTEGIHRQLPMWVGFTGVEHGACNVYTIVSPLNLPHVAYSCCRTTNIVCKPCCNNDDNTYMFQGMLGVCGTSLVSPGWLVLGITVGYDCI